MVNQYLPSLKEGTAPLEGYHGGRLAVERVYGYMVRNAKKYGVLTTVNLRKNDSNGTTTSESTWTMYSELLNEAKKMIHRVG